MMASKQNISSVVRRFVDIPATSVPTLDSTWESSSVYFGATSTWAEILETPRVLLIAEAGTGKTHECKRMQQQLWDEGLPSFYVELSSLAGSELGTSLGGAPAVERFEEWKRDPTSVATFFLDSVDELKLTHASFRSALEAVSRGIGPRADRVRLVVTSRPTEFDHDELLRQFPVRPPAPTAPSVDAEHEFVRVATGEWHHQPESPPVEMEPVRHVKLTPLSPEDIRVFAADLGVTDPDAFVAALLQRDELEFAGRPMDLIELLATWSQFGELRSHREQVEANITVRLKPRPDRERDLSHQDALEGAQTLALSALLMRKLLIRYGAGTDETDAAHVIDPVEVLPTWTQTAHQALLERGLFGHAGYGRVRFHHRSVIEYLAAEKLHALLTSGTPVRDVFDLLFVDTTEGLRAIRPAMRPTAAWLAARSIPVFRELLARQPEALLLHGDPASLSVNERLAAFRAYADRAGALHWEGTSFPMEQIRRFASLEMTHEAIERLKAGVTNPDLRRLCIRTMAAHPTADACLLADTVLRAAASDTLERCYAAEVLVAASSSLVAKLAHDLAHTSAWTDDDALAIAARLVPAHMSVQQTVALLARVNPEGSDATHNVSWTLVNHFSSGSASDEDIAEFQSLLTDVVLDGMRWHKEWPHLRATRGDLLVLLGATCFQRFQSGHGDVRALAAAVIIPAVAASADRHESPVSTIRNMAMTWPPSLRAAAFFATDALHQGFHPESEPFRRLWATQDGLFDFDDTRDAQWLSDAAGNRGLPTDLRAVALEASVRGVKQPDVTISAHFRYLARLVADDPALTARVEFARQAAKPKAEDRKWLQADRLRRDASAREKQKNENDWRRFRERVKADPAKAFDAGNARSTTLNLWRAMRRAKGSELNSNWNRTFIETTFDKDVADRLRGALMRHWREVRPSLPSERQEEEKGIRYESWFMGLSGLAAEAEDSSWARRLTTDEALLAARYVLAESNRFPAWIDCFARVHPEGLLAALSADVDEELGAMLAANPPTLLLQNLRDAPEQTRTLFMPNIERWLESSASALVGKTPGGAPNHSMRLACELICDWGSSRAQVVLETVAEQSLRNGSTKAWALQWLSTLFRLNREKAIDMLELRLGDGGDGSDTEAPWLLAGLFGDLSMHDEIPLNSPNLGPGPLARLTRLAFRHIRTEDDVVRGGSFSPDTRDDAQLARSRLLGALFDTEGPGSWEAKLSIAAEPAVAAYKDRVLAIAREGAARLADGVALDPTQVRSLLQSTAVPPKTRDQMFALMRNRLDDIEEGLRDEASSREAMAALPNEKLMRRQISALLKSVARGAYTVVQESVTAEEKEMDVRLVSTASTEAGVIELKVGNERAGRDLRDTIEKQLVTLYLGSPTQKAGCLLVTVSNDASWQDPDSGEQLDIDGLRHMLSLEAKRVEHLHDDRIRLSVKVLDLRLPPGTEPRARRKSAKGKPPRATPK
ncbi:ATP-binding protein [Bacillus sp. NP157]|nr:ATP-binding protein [Bacillus sp. NP157]